MVCSESKSAVIEKLNNDRTQLRQAIEVAKNSLFTGRSCNLPKDMLDKLVKLGYI